MDIHRRLAFKLRCEVEQRTDPMKRVAHTVTGPTTTSFVSKRLMLMERLIVV